MGCFICSRIRDDLPIQHKRRYFTSFLIAAYLEHLRRWPGLYRLDFTTSNGALVVSTLLLEQTDISETRVYTPQSRRLDSPEVLKLARSWIAECFSSLHENCPGRTGFGSDPSKLASTKNTLTKPFDNGIRPLKRSTTFIQQNPPFYPTRLLRLGKVDDDAVTLVVTKNADHRADEETKPEGQYVTLSHCWGSQEILCLHQSNLDVFQNRGILLEDLPPTFRDAIHFARRLDSNVKYIWIDSLCIIQNEEADWLHESSQMFEVYRHSYCNLSATAARDSQQGLYADRNPQHLWDEEVVLSTEDILGLEIGPPQNEEYHGVFAPVQRCKIVDPSMWDRKVDSAPVNTRAWVLQERLLAPRVLHFCEDQIAWECCKLDASESAWNGIANYELKTGVIQERIRLKSLVTSVDSRASLQGNRENTARTALESWKRITERYSLTRLTKPKDKLIALAGIAQQMSDQIGAPYIAGLWDNKYFASQLLWRVDPQWLNGEFHYRSKRPREYRAPSFSWAAIDAPQGVRCAETQDKSKLLFRVGTVHVKHQQTSKFGLVEDSGYIELICTMLPVAIERKIRKSKNVRQADMFTWTLIKNGQSADHNADSKLHPNVYPDSPKDDFPDVNGTSSPVFLVPAYKNSDDDLIGLLLQEIERSPGQFRRVGLSVIPRYVPTVETFLKEGSTDERTIMLF